MIFISAPLIFRDEKHGAARAKYYVAGLLSYGMSCDNKHPAVFTKLIDQTAIEDSIQNWILEELSKLKSDIC